MADRSGINRPSRKQQSEMTTIDLLKDSHVQAVLSVAEASGISLTREALAVLRQDHKSFRMMVAIGHDLVVGFAVLMIDGPRAELIHLAVHPAYRGRYYGTELMEACLRFCEENRCRCLWCDLESDAGGAQEFLRSQGFTARRFLRGQSPQGEDLVEFRRSVEISRKA